MSNKRTEIEALIDKAAKTQDSADALRYTQAALNAANAMCSLKVAEQKE